MEEPIYTLQEAAKRLKVTDRTLHRWLKAGSIKGVKVGGQWRFRESDIMRLWEQQEHQE